MSDYVASITRGEETLQFETLNAAYAAAQAGETIKLLVSEMIEVDIVGLNEGVTLEGADGGGTTIKGRQSGGFNANVVFKDIVFTNYPQSTKSTPSVSAWEYKNNALRFCYSSNGPVSFENCTFDADVYACNFDETANDLSFTGCTFKGWNSFGSGNATITFTNCTFDKGSNYAEVRPYVNTVLTGCTITEAFVAAYDQGLEIFNDGKTLQINNCKVVKADGTTLSTDYTVEDAVNSIQKDTSAIVIGGEQNAQGKFTAGRIIGRNLSAVNGFVADEIKINFLSAENYVDKSATGSIDYTATASGKTLSLGGTVTNSVNVPADVVINEITLEDGAHLTLNSKDSLADGDYAFGPDSIIFINDDMSAEEIAAWKTAHGIDESVELLPLVGGIAAPEADTVVPVTETEKNSYKSHIVNLGVNATLTEDLVAPAADEVIGEVTEGGVTTTFINPVGTIFLNNQGGAYAEVRGNVTQESADEAIVVNNVTAAADATVNGGFATVAGDMNITGNFTAVNQMIIRNGAGGTMTMRDTVMEKEGYLLEAQNIEIDNDGHMVANIKATGTIKIHNNSMDTITGVIDGVEITIDGTGRIENATVIAVDADGNGSLTISDEQLIVNSTLTTDSFWNDETADTVMDKDSVITYNVEFINDGTITVDMTGATEASYLIVNNLSGDNVKLRDFDDITLINNVDGYMLTVLNRQNLVALKTGASQEVLKVSKAWSDYEIGEAIAGLDGFIYGFNAFSNLNDANRGMAANTVTIDAVDHTATEGLSEKINVIDRALTFTGSSNLPATGELTISTDGESSAAAIFAAGSDYQFSKVTFVDAAGMNSLFIGSAEGEATAFGVGTIADTAGDTVSIENATVTAGSYTVNGTDNTLSDVDMTAENLNVASGAIFAVSDSSLSATDASSNAGTIRLSDSDLTAAALENNGTIILNGANNINAALSGTGTIEISTDAVITTGVEEGDGITDTGANSLIFKGTATIVGSIVVGSDIVLDRSGTETEVDVTGKLQTNGNFTLGGDDNFEDYLYVDGLGSKAGSLNGNLIISEDCEVALTNGATLTYAGTFTNNGKVTYSFKSPTDLVYTVIDYQGNGVKTIEDYDLSKISLSKSLKDYTFIVSDSDLVAAKIDTSAIHVDAAWAGSTKGDVVQDAQENKYVYGYNAYAQLTEFIPTFTGGDIVVHGNGTVAPTSGDGEGIEINNPGTYNFTGTEWGNLGYVQLNKARNSERVIVNIDDSNLVATKIQGRVNADFFITDSHLDFENTTLSRGFTCIYANSTLNLTNSVYGYSHYNGDSSAIVAGRDGIVEGQIGPDATVGKTAVQISGKLIADNSTLFTVTCENGIYDGFSVQDKGYAELTDSVLYAGKVTIGVAQTDTNKQSQGFDVDVATMVLDNSVLSRLHADDYKIEVGRDVAGALIVRNNSLIDRADTSMTVSSDSSVAISNSTVKVASLANAGTITVESGTGTIEGAITNTGTIFTKTGKLVVTGDIQNAKSTDDKTTRDNTVIKGKALEVTGDVTNYGVIGTETLNFDTVTIDGDLFNYHQVKALVLTADNIYNEYKGTGTPEVGYFDAGEIIVGTINNVNGIIRTGTAEEAGVGITATGVINNGSLEEGYIAELQLGDNGALQAGDELNNIGANSVINADIITVKKVTDDASLFNGGEITARQIILEGTDTVVTNGGLISIHGTSEKPGTISAATIDNDGGTISFSGTGAITGALTGGTLVLNHAAFSASSSIASAIVVLGTSEITDNLSSTGSFTVGSDENGALTIDDGKTLTVVGTIGIGLGAGTGLLDVSADSTVTATAITLGDNGTINLTIDATTLTDPSYTLIDITGEDALDTSKITVNGEAFVDGATYGNYTLKLWDGDIILSNASADTTTVFVNAAWAGEYNYGEMVDDDPTKIYGINAVSTFTEAYTNVKAGGTVEFDDDATDAVVAILPEHVGKSLTINGTGTISISGQYTIPQIEATWTVNNDADIKFIVRDNSHGLNIRSNGALVVDDDAKLDLGFLTSRGDITLTNGATLSMYYGLLYGRKDGPASKITITDSELIFDANDYSLEGHFGSGAASDGQVNITLVNGTISGTANEHLVQFDKTATLTASGTSTIQTVKAVLNDGELNLGSGTTLSVGTTLTNNGTINVSGDSLLTIGTLIGTITVNADADLTGSSVVGGVIAVDSAATLTLGAASATSFGAVTNAGEIDIDGTQVNLGALTNSGTIFMDWEDKLTFSGYTHDGGKVDIDMFDYSGVSVNTLILENTGETAMSAADYQQMLGLDDTTLFNKYFTISDGTVDTNDLYLKAGVADVIYVDDDMTIAQAVAKAKTTGATTIDVLDGTFSGDSTFDGIKTVIDGGEFSGGRVTAGIVFDSGSTDTKWRAWKDTEGDETLTVNGGTFNGVVVTGDRLIHGNIEHTGTYTVIITDGEFNSAVAGGMMHDVATNNGDVDQVGNINLKISGGSFTSFIYGGNIARKKGFSGHTSVTGNITITIDVRGENKVGINTLIAGSYGAGTVTGTTEVVLTGLAENLSVSTQIWGGCSGDTYTIKDGKKVAESYVMDVNGNPSSRTLTFQGFTGVLDVKSIKMFSDISFDAETAVTFTSKFAGTLAEIDNWRIAYGSKNTGAFQNDFSGDNLWLTDLDGELAEDWVIFDNTSRFTNITAAGAGFATINGEEAVLTTDLLEGELCAYDLGSYALAFTEASGDKASQMILRNTIA